MINSDKLFPYHYIDIDTMNIISSYAGKDESLFEMDRDEYIVNLTNDMIDSLKKQKLKKDTDDDDDFDDDDDALFEFFF